MGESTWCWRSDWRWSFNGFLGAFHGGFCGGKEWEQMTDFSIVGSVVAQSDNLLLEFLDGVILVNHHFTRNNEETWRKSTVGMQWDWSQPSIERTWWGTRWSLFSELMECETNHDLWAGTDFCEINDGFAPSSSCPSSQKWIMWASLPFNHGNYVFITWHNFFSILNWRN